MAERRPPTSSRSPDVREVVRGLVAREAWAERAFVERFAGHVERVLVRILGAPGDDVDDRVQDALLRVFDRVGELREPEALPGFVTQVTVNVGREALRARRRRRWLRFFAPEDLPEVLAPAHDDEGRAALRALLRVLDGLEDDARIVFTLRHLEGLELAQVAEACDVSLATLKRRLAAAEAVVVRRAARVPELAPWLEGGRRWTAIPS